VLVLDKEVAIAQKSLASDQAIVVVAASLVQLHYYLAESTCDVWLCDLAMEGLDFHAYVDRIRLRNPAARIIVTGPPYLTGAANALMQQGLANAFIPKPWRLMNLRQMVYNTTLPVEESPKRPTAQPAARPANLPTARPAGQTGQLFGETKTAGTTGRILGAGTTGRILGAETTGRILGAGTTGRILWHTKAGEQKNKPSIVIRPTKPIAGGLMIQPRLPPTQPAEAAPTLHEPRYRLDKLLGEGGVGKVYLAHDLLLDTKVAIKILRPDFVGDEEVLQALKNEAKTCMQLTHPHIVRFYDFGQRAGTCYLVMEYVPGNTLYEAMQFAESRQHDYVRAIAITVGSALSHAHTHGVLHNDITPGNILVRPDGVLKLIDFGIATVAQQHRAKSDFVFGTPAYMSPEQLRCDPILDATTDVFALGVLLHQMLTGFLPQDEHATHEELALRPRPPITKLATPIAAVLDRALAFDPAQRWQSIRELVTAFDASFNV
jgi:CheY-like chemotaxis protein